jgi:hypothetical protein
VEAIRGLLKELVYKITSRKKGILSIEESRELLWREAQLLKYKQSTHRSQRRQNTKQKVKKTIRVVNGSTFTKKSKHL